MILKKLLALALIVASAPAFSAIVTVDFEKTWDFANGDVNNYYNGGTAADGSTGGPNLGVSFVNVSGLTNDALGPYFSGAPSPQSIAYAHDTGAYMNVTAGAVDALTFYYSSPSAVIGAVTAWSGLNGTGTLLGSFDIASTNATGIYDRWTQATFAFSGTALSFDFTGTSGIAGLDNVSVNAVPLPAAVWLFGAGWAAMFGAGKRRKQA